MKYFSWEAQSINGEIVFLSVSINARDDSIDNDGAINWKEFKTEKL